VGHLATLLFKSVSWTMLEASRARWSEVAPFHAATRSAIRAENCLADRRLNRPQSVPCPSSKRPLPRQALRDIRQPVAETNWRQVGGKPARDPPLARDLKFLASETRSGNVGNLPHSDAVKV
jgi:hypothetical protein